MLEQFKIPKWYTFMFYLSLAVFCNTQVKAQNDTLVLKNKDKLIGDIKEMNKGVLTIETDYSDSDFQIKWKDVIYVSSDQTYLMSLSNGRRVNSKLQTKTGDSNMIVLTQGTEVIETKITDVVYVKAIENSFISRLDASLSIGFNFAKTNNLTQFSVLSNIGYTADKWGFSAGFNSVRSNQDDVEETKRTDANIGAKYFMRHDWFALANATFLSNDEQLLKLRSSTQGGIGKYIIHSNRVYFATGTGLAWTNENYTDASIDTKNSLEAFLSLELNMFDFDDISLYSNFVVYPSLTESDRVRTDLNLNLKYDLPLDFFVKLGLTHNFDSKPIEGASEVDYVFQTTLGWELD
ncbi:DUF481 domain-containing protein [Formosa algae]|uniref:DUF481 domain-containing protein n=1 Tax=Formosa algae TaxID=225843 RepID=A0A9X1CAU6_9FLAO|nr:DUF481 domain-containing protein [Formosa algae]MBP1839372.1 hypothetical protein [Formosa algae]MDQ0334676.1 hypothetical protein [Formosa algae]OEI81292.1 hypothetical protein AST99_04830 [Formosa algae]PNW27769.1 hypothetical protein BKP44_11320 [Formosa algae]